MTRLARRSGTGWALVAACLFILGGCLPAGQAPAPTPVPSPPSPTAGPPTPTPRPIVNKRGVHLLIDDGADRWPEAAWREHVAWAARLVGRGGYVVQLIRSDDLRPATWQPFFDAAAGEGLIPIVRLATYKVPARQSWAAPRPDPDGQGYRREAEAVRRFFDAIAWRTERVIVTVGNEPNRADEWDRAADPAAYARFLRDVAAELRRVTATRIVVLNAALDASAPSTADPDSLSVDAERFLEGMVAEVPDIFERLDGWASHPYPLGPFSEPPDRQEFRVDDLRPDAEPRPPPAGGLPNRGINGYAWELWKLGELGLRRPLPVYVTESGWRHVRSQTVGSRDAAHATVGDEELADYVALAFDGPAGGTAIGWTPWNDDPRVAAVALFALAGRPDEWGHTNLLLVDPGGRISGAYPVAERLSRVRPGRG